MVFSDRDRAVIEACFREKGWRVARIVKEFPGKHGQGKALLDWSKRSKILARLQSNREVVDQEQHVPTKIKTMSRT